MEKINFENKPSTDSPINATNLNTMQDNVENGINDVQANLENKINGIIESGSNENGSYIKYADGTMICYKTVVGTIDISTAWGNLYTSEALNLGLWPVSFISRPSIMINTQNQTGTQFMLGGSTVASVGSASDAGSTSLIRPSTRTGVAYQLDVIGIGRWK